jgi:hypothetical protein
LQKLHGLSGVVEDFRKFQLKAFPVQLNNFNSLLRW